MGNSQDEINEQILIGSVFINEDIRKAFLFDISPDDFYCDNHKSFIYAAKQLHENNLSYTVDTIYEYALKRSSAVKIEYNYIIQLIGIGKDQNIGADSFKHYLGRTRTRTLAGNIKDTEAKKLDFTLDDPNINGEDILKIMYDIRKKVSDSRLFDEIEYKNLTTWGEKWIKNLEKRRREKDFVPSGFTHLDYFLSEGFTKKKVSIIAGRPGSGKSSFAVNVANRLCMMNANLENGMLKDLPAYEGYRYLRKPVYCALCALEMDGIGTLDRVAAIRTGIPLMDIIKEPENLSNIEVEMLEDNIIKHDYMFIDDTPRQTLDAVAQRIYRLKEKYKIEDLVLFIDLFGKLDDMNGKVSTTTAAAYEDTLRRTQILAKELDIHICLVAQINRAAESKKGTDVKNSNKADDKQKIVNNRASISHLKNSGAFEEVADLILILYRPKYYQPNILEDICEVHIAKQRQGVMGKVVNLLFIGGTTTLMTTTKVLKEQSSCRVKPIGPDDFKNPDLYYSQLNVEENNATLRARTGSKVALGESAEEENDQGEGDTELADA